MSSPQLNKGQQENEPENDNKGEVEEIKRGETEVKDIGSTEPNHVRLSV